MGELQPGEVAEGDQRVGQVMPVDTRRVRFADARGHLCFSLARKLLCGADTDFCCNVCCMYDPSHGRRV